MINYEYEDLFKQDSVKKSIIISFSGGTFTNTDLYSEDFTLEESLCSEQSLQFGACESSCLKFKIGKSLNSLKNKTITVDMILNGDIDTVFRIGTFKVESDVPTANRFGREITAYDAMYEIINTDVSAWYDALTFPMTLLQFRNSLCAHLGVTQVSVSLPNDGMTVTKTIDTDELSGGDVLKAICEINGAFGHITRDNKLTYVLLDEIAEGLYPSTDLYPDATLYPQTGNTDAIIGKSLYKFATWEDYKVSQIDKVQIRQEENDIGASYGTGDNVYTLQGNFLAYGLNQSALTTVATNLYNAICKIAYTPVNVECVGNPCVEVGDTFRISADSDILYSYVMQRTLSGVQALNDNYVSTGDQLRETVNNSISSEIKQLRGKTNVLERNIDETRSVIGTVEQGQTVTSMISQTAQQIQTSVAQTYETKTNASTTKTTLESAISQNATAISARVTKTGGTSSSFAWNLTDNAFTLTSNNRQVFKCDANGITVDGYATVSTLNAVSGRVGSLESDHVSASEMTAVELRCGSLEADNVTIQGNLSALTATVNAISANYVTTSQLNATNARIGTLETNELKADRAIVNGIAYSFGFVTFSIPNGYRVKVGNTYYTCEATGSAGYQCFGNA